MTQVITKPKRKKSADDERNHALKALESELLEECLVVSRDMMRFREIQPDQAEPPEEWVREVGYEKAMERLRCALAGHDNRKNAPIAVQLAVQLGVGIMKSRASEKSGSITLNAMLVGFPAAAAPTFAIVDIPADER